MSKIFFAICSDVSLSVRSVVPTCKKYISELKSFFMVQYKPTYQTLLPMQKVVVVGGGDGIDDISVGAVLITMSAWCLFVSGICIRRQKIFY